MGIGSFKHRAGHTAGPGQCSEAWSPTARVQQSKHDNGSRKRHVLRRRLRVHTLRLGGRFADSAPKVWLVICCCAPLCSLLCIPCACALPKARRKMRAQSIKRLLQGSCRWSLKWAQWQISTRCMQSKSLCLTSSAPAVGIRLRHTESPAAELQATTRISHTTPKMCLQYSRIVAMQESQ